MGDLFITPFKIFLIGILLAVVATFTWQSVEIVGVHDAAVNAAHSAVANTNNYLSAASSAAKSTINGATVDNVTQIGNNLTQATVSYNPPQIASSVFQFLGVTNPNKTITMVGTAPGTLDTLTLNVPKTIGAGTSQTITGTLMSGKNTPIANTEIKLTTSGGTLNTITTSTDSNGDFATIFKAPNTIGSIKVTASGNGINVSETINVVADVVITSNTPAIVGGSVTVKGKVTNGVSGIPNTGVTISSDPSVAFSGGGTTTTDSNGNFTFTFTAPSSGGILNLVANSDGGVTDPPYSIQVISAMIGFSQKSYSIGVTHPITINGSVTLNGAPDSGITLSITQSGTLLTSSFPMTTTTNSNGDYSFTVQAGVQSGSESLFISDGGTSSILPLTVTGASIDFNQSSYTIGVTQSNVLSGTVVSNNDLGQPESIQGNQTFTINNPSYGSVTSTDIPVSSGAFAIAYSAGVTSGTDSILATGSTFSGSGTTSVVVAQATVAFSPTIYSQQMGSSVTLTGQVTSLNSSGSLVGVTQSTNVALSSSPFNISTSVTSDSSGSFSYSFTAPLTPTSGTVVATALGESGYASVATAAPNVSVTSSQSIVGVNGGTSTITVEVSAGTTPLQGQSVSLSVSGGGTLSATSGVTNSSGQVQVVFTGSSVGSSFTISATSDGVPAITSISVHPVITGVSFNTSTWAPTVTITGQGFGTPTGTTSGASQNQFVQLGDINEGWQANSQNSGMIISESTWNNTQVVTSGIGGYGSNGIWQLFPNDAGYVNIANPQTNQNTGNFDFTYPSNAEMPTITGLATSNGAAQQNATATITGNLYLNGNSGAPIVNAPVALTLSGPQIGTFSNGSTSITVTTNSSGRFSDTFTTNSTVGSSTITVMTPDNPSTSASVGQSNGYYTFSGFSASPTTALPSATVTLTGALYYYNGTNNGWSGLPINFTDSLGSSQQTTTTSSNGTFSYPFVLSGNSGSDTITATFAWNTGVTANTNVQVGIGIIGTISTEMFPDAIAYDPVNHDMYISENNVDVGVIDTSTNKVIDTIKNVATSGAVTSNIVYDPKSGDIYVECGGSNGDSVAVINPTTNTVITSFYVGIQPTQMVVGNGYIYVAVSESAYANNNSAIAVINDSTNSLETTWGVAKLIRHTSNPYPMTYDPSNGDLYVSEYNSGYVFIFNGDQYVKYLSLGSAEYPNMSAYDPNNGDIYVATYSSGDIVINGSTNTVTSASNSGSGPARIVFDPVNGNIYELTTNPFTVLVINGNTNTVIATVGVTYASSSLAVDPKTGNVYVLNGYGTGYNSEVISGTTNSIISSFYLAGFNGWAYDNANGDMYIATVSDPGVVYIVN